MLRSPAMGALTQLYAATMPQALDYGGKVRERSFWGDDIVG